MLAVGLPKGTLEQPVLSLLKAGGFDIDFRGRKLQTSCRSFPGVVFVRLKAVDIPRLVAEGQLMCGIAGFDQVLEQGYADKLLRSAIDLDSSKTIGRPIRWTFAVQEECPATSIAELWLQQSSAGKNALVVATEIPRIVDQWLRTNNIKANIIRTSGSTEALIPWLADAIVDIVDSGQSLRENGLRELDVVMPSTSRLWHREGESSKLISSLVQSISSGKTALKI